MPRRLAQSSTPRREPPPHGGSNAAGFSPAAADRGDRARTCDLRFWRPTLYQLSYAPPPCEFTGRVAARLQGREGAVALLDDQAVELELGECGRRDVGAEARCERQRVSAAGAAAELGPENAGDAGRRFAARRLQLDLDAERVEDVAGAADRRRSRAQQRERSAAEFQPWAPGHGEHVAADRERVIGRDQRAGAARRLDHDRRLRERGDDAVADGEAPGCRLDARPPLRDDRAGRRDARGERGVAARVVAVDAAAQHRDRAAAAVEGAGVRRRRRCRARGR